tara:strand:+ start:133 stop:663 length:531 start_codon:yes stop_codon:yes gene_type:complete
MEMYDLSVPLFKRRLSTLSAILKKVNGQFKDRKFGNDEILNAKLAPDMLNFTRQVQLSTDFMKNGVGRLAGIKLKRFEDDEKTFEELQTRLIKTISCLNEILPEQINGSENRIIRMKIEKKSFEFFGFDFLQNFVTPNVYFHLSIAYGILRANNYDIGKADYLGQHVLQKGKLHIE